MPSTCLPACAAGGGGGDGPDRHAARHLALTAAGGASEADGGSGSLVLVETGAAGAVDGGGGDSGLLDGLRALLLQHNTMLGAELKRSETLVLENERYRRRWVAQT